MELIKLRLQRESVQSAQQLAFVYGIVRNWMFRWYQVVDLKKENLMAIKKKRDYDWTREENCYRLAAYLDSMSVRTVSRQNYINKQGAISNNDQYETYLREEARLIDQTLFRDLDDDEVAEWTSRLAKQITCIHIFLSRLMEHGESLKDIDKTVEENRVLLNQQCQSLHAYQLVFCYIEDLSNLMERKIKPVDHMRSLQSKRNSSNNQESLKKEQL
jgi:hypothetical protein